MIYFIEAEGLDLIKVGYARNVAKRLRELQCGSPVQLRIVASFEGSPADERDAHRALHKAGGQGEWFPRKRAVAFLRIWRRTGRPVASDVMRWNENERSARRRHQSFVRKATRLVARRMGEEALRRFSPEQIKRATGLTAATWRRAALGRTVPQSHHFLNSLAWSEQPHVANLIRSTTGMELIPQMQAVVDEDDARRKAA